MSELHTPESLTNPVIIEDARAGDAQDICELLAETWLATYTNPQLGITEEKIRQLFYNQNGELFSSKIDNWERRIENMGERRRIYVARADDKVLGFTSPKIEADGTRRLGALYVLPQAQGLGIGSKLLQKSLEWHGDNDVYLHVVAYNDTAIDFYTRHGFEMLGDIPKDQLHTFEDGATIPETAMIRRVS